MKEEIFLKLVNTKRYKSQVQQPAEMYLRRERTSLTKKSPLPPPPSWKPLQRRTTTTTTKRSVVLAHAKMGNFFIITGPRCLFAVEELPGKGFARCGHKGEASEAGNSYKIRAIFVRLSKFPNQKPFRFQKTPQRHSSAVG